MQSNNNWYSWLYSLLWHQRAIIQLSYSNVTLLSHSNVTLAWWTSPCGTVGVGTNSTMDSSTNFQAPPQAAYFLWSCDKVYHKQKVCLVLYFLGQIVSWQYNPNLLDENWPCTVINVHDWQVWNCPIKRADQTGGFFKKNCLNSWFCFVLTHNNLINIISTLIFMRHSKLCAFLYFFTGEK